MDKLIVALVGGAQLGAVYAIVALGVVLAFRGTGTFNFAHGQFMLLPTFVVGAWQAKGAGPLIPALILALGGTGLVAALFYRFVLQRTTGLPVFMGVIATLGLASVLDGVVVLVFGTPSFQIQMDALPGGIVEILGARFSASSLVLAGIAIVICAGVAAFLRFTQVGLRTRAAGQQPLLASQNGINVRRIYALSWAAAGILAAVAGVIYGTTNVADASLVGVALTAFPAIMIGGIDSVGGALVGGLIVGVFQGFVAAYLSTPLVVVFTYALLLVVLLSYPQGLFGSKNAVRV